MVNNNFFMTMIGLYTLFSGARNQYNHHNLMREIGYLRNEIYTLKNDIKKKHSFMSNEDDKKW